MNEPPFVFPRSFLDPFSFLHRVSTTGAYPSPAQRPTAALNAFCLLMMVWSIFKDRAPTPPSSRFVRSYTL